MSKCLSMMALLGAASFTGACTSDTISAGTGGPATDQVEGGTGGATGGPDAGTVDTGGPDAGTVDTGGAGDDVDAGGQADAVDKADTAPSLFGVCRDSGTESGALAPDAGGVMSTPVCGGSVVAPGQPPCLLPIFDQHSFPKGIIGVSDGVSTAQIHYQPATPSTFCLSGRVSGSATAKGWAFLGLGFGTTGPLDPFDLAAHHISKFRFRISQDFPVTGLHVTMVSIPDVSCTTPDCGANFALTGRDHVACPGTVTAATSDFSPKGMTPLGSRLEKVSAPFDPKLFTNLLFEVDAPAGVAFNYAFCIRDLTFLDANDQEVQP